MAHRVTAHRSQPRVQHLAQAIADDVDAEDEEDQQQARIDADPVLARHQNLVAVGDEEAEGRLGDRQADAEEAQRRFRRDGVRHLQRADHDERRQAVRQQVAEEDACLAKSEAGRRLDVFLALLDQGRAAHGAGEQRPLHQHQGEHHLADALADEREHHQRHEDGREAEHQVDEAHDQRVDAAAEIGGDQAERRPDPERHDAADDADREARAQAVDHGRQHVAALSVRAEPIGAARHALRARRRAWHP